MDIGFLVSFSAGVASVLSPCVLPLIPIVVGYFLLNRKISQTIPFLAGFFLVFTVITILTVLFTAAINHYLLYFRIAAALIIIAVGFLFILNKNVFKFSYTPRYDRTILGSFLMGFFTCLAWSPCYGPYIVAIAAYSVSTGNWIYTASNLILFTAGFSLSLLVLAFLASKIKFKGMTKYSEWIRIFSGIIITIAGIYLFIGLI
jgi:cytochrome c-type biogenesis protein